MNQYHLTLLGMCEVRWNSHGETRLQTGEVLLYSGKDSDDDRHEAGGVSLLLSKHATKSPMDRVGTSVRPHRHCSICVPIPECVRCHVLATPRQTTQGKMIRTASMPSFSQLLIRYQEGTCSS